MLCLGQPNKLVCTSRLAKQILSWLDCNWNAASRLYDADLCRHLWATLISQDVVRYLIRDLFIGGLRFLVFAKV